MRADLSAQFFYHHSAAIVLATLPIIVVFLCMQKQFVEGIVGTSK